VRYADDAGRGRNFQRILAYFHWLRVELGPDYGYFPEPIKRILEVGEHSKEAAEVFFEDLCFTTIVTRACYLGGLVGEILDQPMWVEKEATEWSDSHHRRARLCGGKSSASHLCGTAKVVTSKVSIPAESHR
jgi:hypothetical protein